MKNKLVRISAVIACLGVFITVILWQQGRTLDRETRDYVATALPQLMILAANQPQHLSAFLAESTVDEQSRLEISRSLAHLHRERAGEFKSLSKLGGEGYAVVSLAGQGVQRGGFYSAEIRFSEAVKQVYIEVVQVDNSYKLKALSLQNQVLDS